MALAVGKLGVALIEVHLEAIECTQYSPRGGRGPVLLGFALLHLRAKLPPCAEWKRRALPTTCAAPWLLLRSAPLHGGVGGSCEACSGSWQPLTPLPHVPLAAPKLKGVVKAVAACLSMVHCPPQQQVRVTLAGLHAGTACNRGPTSMCCPNSQLPTLAVFPVACPAARVNALQWPALLEASMHSGNALWA
jgi:hypothetical protein